MDSTQDGGFKVRSRMILINDGQATAICPNCKHKVTIPVILGDTPLPLPKSKIVVNK